MADVTAPDGTRWYVRRRWAPRVLGREGPWARFKRRHREGREIVGDVGPDAGCSVDIGEGIFAVIGIVLVALALAFFVLPALIALGELLLIVLLALGGVVARVLFRRPWTVDALGPGDLHHEWRVVGWRASGDARDTVARHLEATGRPPNAL